uniref:BOD1/SHG1 domain-containing protein n=1 Tax=Denticeps clupeoides TaxID=299321 RepID=A0AAY4E7F7_9TELE
MRISGRRPGSKREKIGAPLRCGKQQCDSGGVGEPGGFKTALVYFSLSSSSSRSLSLAPMAGLPPGDPQLVSMIVHHLKTQGLFDQFRRDCLADVDTKPAYLNLRQRVDNFVSNHLSNHTWSPHLNKNQLRNNIRQLVLQSGMLEQGVDRIVAQVVDPKIQHIFRPQVERVVREFVSPGSHAEEPVAYPSSAYNGAASLTTRPPLPHVGVAPA